MQTYVAARIFSGKIFVKPKKKPMLLNGGKEALV